MTGVWIALGVVAAFVALALVVRWAANDPGKVGEVVASAHPAEDEPPLNEWEAVPAAPAPDALALIEVLRTGEPGPCREAVERLVALGEAALPALEAAEQDDDPDLRFDVRRALRTIRGELPE